MGGGGAHPEVDDGVGGGVTQQALLGGAPGQRDPDALQQPGARAHGVVLIVPAQENCPRPVPAAKTKSVKFCTIASKI